MKRPILYIFTISHYCEKARWALDYLGIDAELRILAPGTHIKVAKSLGLKRGSVPFLQLGDTTLQGSDAIITWAEKNQKHHKSLGSQNSKVMAFEKRLDDKLGVHVRRWFYSEAILEHPHLVKPVFMHGISAWEKIKLSIKWPLIGKLMVRGMDLGFEQGGESLSIVHDEIAWIETHLADGNRYLVDNTFSRADIAAASLLAPLVAPKEYSCSSLMVLPPRAEQQSEPMKDRPFWHWVEMLYQNHRASPLH